MRIIFTFVGGNGHFEPLIPIAHTATEAGHTVAFGCGPSMVSRVAAVGLSVFALSDGPARTPNASNCARWM
jgi:UDP:flavonoid glycosyltransferase YjiC (YdhE family)